MFVSGATADGIKPKVGVLALHEVGEAGAKSLEGRAAQLEDSSSFVFFLFFFFSLKFPKCHYNSHSSGCEGWLSRW